MWWGLGIARVGIFFWQGGGVHPVAIVLVLSAALAHAGWNLFAKRVPDGGAVFVWLAAIWGVVFQLPIAILFVVRDGMAALPRRPVLGDIILIWPRGILRSEQGRLATA